MLGRSGLDELAKRGVILDTPEFRTELGGKPGRKIEAWLNALPDLPLGSEPASDILLPSILSGALDPDAATTFAIPSHLQGTFFEASYYQSLLSVSGNGNGFVWSNATWQPSVAIGCGSVVSPEFGVQDADAGLTAGLAETFDGGWAAEVTDTRTGASPTRTTDPLGETTVTSDDPFGTTQTSYVFQSVPNAADGAAIDLTTATGFRTIDKTTGDILGEGRVEPLRVRWRDCTVRMDVRARGRAEEMVRDFKANVFPERKVAFLATTASGRDVRRV